MCRCCSRRLVTRPIEAVETVFARSVSRGGAVLKGVDELRVRVDF